MKFPCYIHSLNVYETLTLGQKLLSGLGCVDLFLDSLLTWNLAFWKHWTGAGIEHTARAGDFVSLSFLPHWPMFFLVTHNYLFNTWYALCHPCLVITLCLTSGWLWRCYIGLWLSVFGILGLVGKAMDVVFLLLLWRNKQVIGSLASWQSLKFNATWQVCRILLLACLKICPDVATLNPHPRRQQWSVYFLPLDVTPVDAQ